MHISGSSFSSALFSSAGRGGASGLGGLDALDALGGLDGGLLSGGFGQLDRFGGVGGLGGELVQGLLSASGFKALQDVARLLSQADGSGALGGARSQSSCGSCGNRDPMSANKLDGDLGKGIGGAAKANGQDSYMSRLPPNATFEDLVAAFMMDEVKKMQDELKQEMAKMKASNQTDGGKGANGGAAAGGAGGGGAGKAASGAGGGGAAGGAGGDNGDSRQLMFEELKNKMNKLQQMLQSMSNVLNTMHQGAMNSIRNIRA